MNFLELLRKLGILSYGVDKGVYHGGKERPLEFVSDDMARYGSDDKDAGAAADSPASNDD